MTNDERLKNHIAERDRRRKEFPPGEWDTEPERTEFTTAAGFPAITLRSGIIGALCGYVGVPPGHPWHGKYEDDIECEVHGGLTYASECGGEVCHVARPGESEDLWWVGFDCAHAFDYSPGLDGGRLPPLACSTYKNLAYVKNECERLAAQALVAQNAR
jgi:hypothetical protein